MLLSLAPVRSVRAEVPGARNLDQGWRLWLDPQAPWRDDALYLPEDVHLASLPVNPPTGGWPVLARNAGMAVSLPATVEEHCFNQGPARVSASTKPADIVGAHGSYHGVSWWYRPFSPLALARGERLILHFPGGRLRSEVYVNGKLVGYSILSEAPFDADATDAVRPGGPNVLAVRVTNPGGRLDWIDYLSMKWGATTLPATHDFGGLSGGVEQQVRGAASVSDLAVFNKPDPRSVRLRAEVTSIGSAYDGPVEFSVRRGRDVVFLKGAEIHVPAGATVAAAVDATVGSALLWDIGRPNLYLAWARLPAVPHSDRGTTFGFRWLEPRGIGSDAKLYLNGRRIVPRSAISWGYWAPNGIFPDEAAAGREIEAMRALGLDSIQNHRHMPKAVVLDAFDRAGFLRYCEAGGGVFTFEDGADDSAPAPVRTAGAAAAPDFLNRYQLDKEIAMIRAFRSHPCVSVWTLQNETSPAVTDPRVMHALNRMREEDPSRAILLKSGVGPEHQVWTLPYGSGWMRDDGSTYSGWRDQHTATDSPGVWVDAAYRSPSDFEYRSDVKKEVVVWGEMATGASPDDHAAIVGWYARKRRTGYDLAAHREILAAYDRFLDERGFREAFPSAEALFRAAAAKHYFSAAHLLENARICDNVDYIVLSGWESTTIDNHSGLVDALRQLKGDPSPIREASRPEVLVIRPRHDVVAAGGTAIVDVHLINEGGLRGAWRMAFTAATAARAPIFRADYPVELAGGETFGQLLKQDIRFTVRRPGPVTLHAELIPGGGGGPALQGDEPLLAIDPQPGPVKATVACAGETEELMAALDRQFGAKAVAFSRDLGRVDTILFASEGGGVDTWLPSEGDAAVSGTGDPGLYRRQLWGGAGPVHTWRGLAPGRAEITLYMADSFLDGPGERLFDVAINGKTVARGLDIIAGAGGKNRALVETFAVDAPEGTVRLSVPRVESDHATLAAVRLRDSAGRVIRAVFRAEPYTDPSGNRWTPVTDQDDGAWRPDLGAAIERVRRDGARLVLLTSGGWDAARIAAFLGRQGLVDYEGPAGSSGPSWMGFWFFGRRHALLAGLPSDCVLDWPYQIVNGNGVMISGPGVETVIGYGRDHDPDIGVAAAVVRCGRGRIVLLALPGLRDSFMSGGASGGIQPVTGKRLMYNALAQPF